MSEKREKSLLVLKIWIGVLVLPMLILPVRWVRHSSVVPRAWSLESNKSDNICSHEHPGKLGGIWFDVDLNSSTTSFTFLNCIVRITTPALQSCQEENYKLSPRMQEFLLLFFLISVFSMAMSMYMFMFVGHKVWDRVIYCRRPASF